MITAKSDLQQIKTAYEEKMGKYTYQALVCFGTGCTSAGCKTIRDTLVEEIEKYGLEDKVAVIERGCMGTCAVGPVIYTLPDETYYTEMTPEKVRENGAALRQYFGCYESGHATDAVCDYIIECLGR